MVCEIALNNNFLFGFADSVYIFQFEGTRLVELFICCWTLAKIYFSTFIFDRLDAVAIIFAVVAVAVAIVFAVVAVAVGHLQIFHFFDFFNFSKKFSAELRPKASFQLRF